jgi:hypothetical protein
MSVGIPVLRHLSAIGWRTNPNCVPNGELVPMPTPPAARHAEHGRAHRLPGRCCTPGWEVLLLARHLLGGGSGRRRLRLARLAALQRDGIRVRRLHFGAGLGLGRRRGHLRFRLVGHRVLRPARAPAAESAPPGSPPPRPNPPPVGATPTARRGGPEMKPYAQQRRRQTSRTCTRSNSGTAATSVRLIEDVDVLGHHLLPFAPELNPPVASPC